MALMDEYGGNASPHPWAAVEEPTLAARTAPMEEAIAAAKAAAEAPEDEGNAEEKPAEAKRAHYRDPFRLAAAVAEAEVAKAAKAKLDSWRASAKRSQKWWEQPGAAGTAPKEEANANAEGQPGAAGTAPKEEANAAAAADKAAEEAPEDEGNAEEQPGAAGTAPEDEGNAEGQPGAAGTVPKEEGNAEVQPREVAKQGRIDQYWPGPKTREEEEEDAADEALHYHVLTANRPKKAADEKRGKSEGSAKAAQLLRDEQLNRDGLAKQRKIDQEWLVLEPKVVGWYRGRKTFPEEEQSDDRATAAEEAPEDGGNAEKQPSEASTPT